MRKDILFGFDLDGTISDTTEVDDLCFEEVLLEEYGLVKNDLDWSDFDPNHFSDWGLVKFVLEKFLNRRFSFKEMRRVNDLLIGKYEKRFREKASYFQEIPGAVSFIRLLKRKKVPVAIATGSWHNSALFKLSKVGLDTANIPIGHSDVDITRSGFMGYAFELAKENRSDTSEKVVYFGDGEWDFRTCEKLNVPLIGIDRHRNGKLTALGLGNVFTDYTEPDRIFAAVDLLFP